MNNTHNYTIKEVQEILEQIVTVAPGDPILIPVDDSSVFEEVPVLEVTNINLDQFHVLYETLWRWVQEQEIQSTEPKLWQSSGVFIKKNGRLQHAEAREALEALTKAKVLTRKFGNQYGQGAKHSLDDFTIKPREIVRYESDWMDYNDSL